MGGALAAACVPLGDRRGGATTAGPEPSGELQLGWYSYAAALTQVPILVDAFQQAHPRLKVNVDLSSSFNDYFAKYQVQASSGDAPDVSIMSIAFFTDFAKRGLLADLSPFITRDKLDLKQWFPVMADLCRYEKGSIFPGKGNMYALPWDLQANPVLYYNVDLFEKKGLAPPDRNATWDKLLETARLLTQRVGSDADQWGLVPSLGSWSGPWVFTWQAGGELISSDFARATADSPGHRRALEFLHDLMYRYQVAPPPATPGASAPDWWGTGRAAMALQGQWQIPAYAQQLAFRWDIAPLASGPAGKRSASVFGAPFALAAAGKRQDAAWALLKWLCTQPGQTIGAVNDFPPPSVQAVADSYYHRTPPKSRPILLDQFKDDPHVPYVFTKWNDLAGYYDKALTAFWRNEEALDSALGNVNDRVNQILREARQA